MKEPSHPYTGLAKWSSSTTSSASASRPATSRCSTYRKMPVHIGRLAVAKAAATVVAHGLGNPALVGDVYAIDEFKLAGGDPVGELEAP